MILLNAAQMRKNGRARRIFFVLAVLFLIPSLRISQAFADETYFQGIVGMIAKSKAQDALISFDAYKTKVEACLGQHPTTAKTSCAGLSPFPPTTYFTYTFSPDSLFVDNATYATDNYTLVATPTAATGAQDGSVMMFIRNNGTFTCQGTGSFAGVC